MAKSANAIHKTLGKEGGYVNDPDDRGGKTYLGITITNFPNWTGWAKIRAWEAIHGVPKTGKIFTEEEIPGLRADVVAFYVKNFWNPILGDDIINEEVAEDLFDTAVNMGVGTAIKLCQRALGVEETGKMNATTLNILNTQNSY